MVGLVAGLWAKAAAEHPSGPCQVETQMQAGRRRTTTKGSAAARTSCPHLVVRHEHHNGRRLGSWGRHLQRVPRLQEGRLVCTRREKRRKEGSSRQRDARCITALPADPQAAGQRFAAGAPYSQLASYARPASPSAVSSSSLLQQGRRPLRCSQCVTVATTSSTTMTAQTMPIVAPLGPSWWELLLQCCTGSLDAAAAPPPSANTPLTAEPANVKRAAGEHKRWSREAAPGPNQGRGGVAPGPRQRGARRTSRRRGQGAGHGRAIQRWLWLLCPTCILQEAPEAPGWVHRSGPSRSLVPRRRGTPSAPCSLYSPRTPSAGGRRLGAPPARS